MSTAYPHSADLERGLLEAARGGDGDAYGRLVAGRRGELQAHCYRMLGSIQDAEDALQDALLRAWRGLRGFDGRSSLRAWLYRIATNACLDLIARRQRRVLPVEHGTAAPPNGAPGVPIAESVFIEPYPDEALGVADSEPAPEARYEQHESVELAFVAAMQHLPSRQRAVLILRDVLAFSAREVAESLDTSVPAVNSALQRARQTMADRLPERSQQATLRALGDAGVRDLVERYTSAMQSGDVDAVVAMLTEDATWSMPPLPTWYAGRDAVAGFLTGYGLTVRWRHLPARANGQVAVGCYAWDASQGAYIASVLDVLTVEGGRIASVDGFATAEVFRRLASGRTPYVPSAIFPRFGLPDRLPPQDR